MATQTHPNLTAQAVTVRLMLSPVRSRDGHYHWQQWDAPAGQPLCDYLPAGIEAAAVIVDGKRLLPDHWDVSLSAGQEMTIMPAWGDPVTMAVVTGIVTSQAFTTALVS